jgi:hypothetical protein
MIIAMIAVGLTAHCRSSSMEKWRIHKSGQAEKSFRAHPERSLSAN